MQTVPACPRETVLIKTLSRLGANRGPVRKKLLDAYGGNRQKAARLLDRGLRTGVFAEPWLNIIQRVLALGDQEFAALIDVQNAQLDLVQQAEERACFKPSIQVRWHLGRRRTSPIFVLSLLHNRTCRIAVPKQILDSPWSEALGMLSGLIAEDAPLRQSEFGGLMGEIVQYECFLSYGIIHRFSPQGSYLESIHGTPPPGPRLTLGTSNKDITPLLRRGFP